MTVNSNIQSLCQMAGIRPPTNGEVESGAFNERVTRLVQDLLSNANFLVRQDTLPRRASEAPLTNSQREVRQQTQTQEPRPQNVDDLEDPDDELIILAQNNNGEVDEPGDRYAQMNSSTPPPSDTEGQPKVDAQTQSGVLENSEGTEGKPQAQTTSGQAGLQAKNGKALNPANQAQTEIETAEVQQASSAKEGKAANSTSGTLVSVNGKTYSVQKLLTSLVNDLGSAQQAAKGGAPTSQNLQSTAVKAKALALLLLMNSGASSKSSLSQNLTLANGMQVFTKEQLAVAKGILDSGLLAASTKAADKAQSSQNSISAAPNMSQTQAIQTNHTSSSKENDNEDSPSQEEPLKGTKIGVPYTFVEHLTEKAQISFKAYLNILEALGADLQYIALDQVSDALDYVTTKEIALDSLKKKFLEFDLIVTPADSRLIEHSKVADLLGLYGSAANFSELTSAHALAEGLDNCIPIPVQFFAPSGRKKFVSSCIDFFTKGCKSEGSKIASAQ